MPEAVEPSAMQKHVRPQLLPGVSAAGIPPRQVFRSDGVIKRARDRAAFRDGADLLLLLGLDAFFLRWPHAHVPLLDRHDSVVAVVSINVIVVAYVWLCRHVPQWRARRVASTWCGVERARFRR